VEFYTNVFLSSGKIYYTGYEDNRKIRRTIDFKPTLYEEDPNLPNPTHLSLYKNIPLRPLKFDSIPDASNHFKIYNSVKGKSVHGNTDYVSQFINEKYPGDIKFDRDRINVVSLDIETHVGQGFPEPREAAQEITAITVRSSIDKVYYVWGLNGEYNSKDTELNIAPKNIVYEKCVSERELLNKFLFHIQNIQPDVFTGWNITYFDLPYLYNRIYKIIGATGAKRLSPWNKVIVKEDEKSIYGSRQTVQIKGITNFDYLELFKKFSHGYGTQESYSLNHIAHVVLGKEKLDYTEFSSLNELREKDHQKFIDYNIKDVLLIDELDDKLDLITLGVTMAYRGGVDYIKVFGTVGIWDSIIYRELDDKGIVIPPMKMKTDEKVSFPGGYVKDPHIGMHNWVCSFDLNSLYPSIIMQYNMSPETKLTGENPLITVDAIINEKIKNHDTSVSLSCNGVKFDTTKSGVFPQLIEKMYNERVTIKDNMLKYQQALENDPTNKKIQSDIEISKNNQMAIKLLLNSLYGAMGNKYFRYFDLDIAKSVTLTGQTTILWAERHLNRYLNKVMKKESCYLTPETIEKDYVIAIDTDSLYINLSEIIDTLIWEPNQGVDHKVNFLDKLCSEKLEKILESSYEELYKRLGGMSNKMIMKREAIADRGIWTAKKRYILNVHNNEGVQYKIPKLKIMGIEAIKSSTPQIVREKFKESFKIIMAGDESSTQKFISNFREDFEKLGSEHISFPRGVTNVTDWAERGRIYKKGTPIHVRGSLLYNKLLKDLKLEDKYEKIGNGDKIKFIYLKMPNTLRENVISFPTSIPKEFELEQYIDYDKQFNKTFVDPLKLILDAISWNIEETNDLGDFFT
jgi:DNA polymerase elongation subunit (family B)